MLCRLPRGGVDRNLSGLIDLSNDGVASLAEAWIETSVKARSVPHGSGRLPRGGVDRNSTPALTRKRVRASPPSRRRGSKPRRALKTAGRRVASLAEAWNETSTSGQGCAPKPSPPSRRRGSKPRSMLHHNPPAMSPPSRRRGSKPAWAAASPLLAGVASLAEAWIETSCTARRPPAAVVASLAEAWIETGANPGGGGWRLYDASEASLADLSDSVLKNTWLTSRQSGIRLEQAQSVFR